MKPCRKKTQPGFTLVEMITVLAVLLIVSLYAVTKNGNSGAYSLLSQAETMASDIRHAQTLAATWGRSVRITTTSTGYSVSCVTTTGTSPCNVSPVIDPATGASFAVTLENGATLSPAGTLDISSIGRPSAAASYTLSAGTGSKTVNVAALTGFVSLP